MVLYHNTSPSGHRYLPQKIESTETVRADGFKTEYIKNELLDTTSVLPTKKLLRSLHNARVWSGFLFCVLLPNALSPANAEWTIPVNKETRRVTSSSRNMSPSRMHNSERKIMMANADVQINLEWCWSNQNRRARITTTEKVKKTSLFSEDKCWGPEKFLSN